MYHVTITTPEQQKRLKRVPWRGCWIGILTGMSGAILYALSIYGILASMKPLTIIEFGQILKAGALHGAGFGIPAAILGGFTGWLIGFNIKHRITNTKHAVKKVSLIVNIVIIGIISGLFLILKTSQNHSYEIDAEIIFLLVLFIGIPGFIYTILSLIISVWLYDWAHRSKK